jgi:hypothetical protein
MPCRWAISNNSTIAHCTTSGLGSAGCRISFICHLFKRYVFCKAKRYIHLSEIFAGSSTAVCSKLHSRYLRGCPQKLGPQHWCAALQRFVFCSVIALVSLPMCKIGQFQRPASGSIVTAFTGCLFRQQSPLGRCNHDLRLVRIV